MIVLDLEWTQPFGQDSMEEIIQIGAVKIEELGGPVTDSFTVYIKPAVYQELSPDCEASAGCCPFDGLRNCIS